MENIYALMKEFFEETGEAVTLKVTFGPVADNSDLGVWTVAVVSDDRPEVKKADTILCDRNGEYFLTATNADRAVALAELDRRCAIPCC